MASIIICPDSFKGSLSAAEAAAAIERGVRRWDADAETVVLPIADGGEGTLDALVPLCDHIQAEVHGPDGGRISAAYGYIGDTAVIEMATAAGLCLLPDEKRSAADTSTYGVGELISHSLSLGYQRLLITVGGSGTNDGGSGMLEALGARFYDGTGASLTGMNGRKLSRIARIDTEAMDPRLFEAEILIACDVTNPLLGEQGATRIYGPQKGADAQTLDLLEAGMQNYADRLARVGRDVRNVPGSGAGGGIAVPLLALCNAGILSGIEAVLSAQNYGEKLKGAALVITGEGKLDHQSAFGKAVSGVARMAAAEGVPVLALVGIKGDGAEALREMGLTRIATTVDMAPSQAYSMTHAAELLEKLAYREVGKCFKGKDLHR